MRNWINFYVFCLLLVTAGCGPDGFNPSGNVDDEQIAVNVEHAEADMVAVLSWTTEEPMSSRVEFTDDMEDGGTYHWKWYIEDEELTTDHEVKVIGMVPEATYYLRGISEDEEGRIESAPYFFETPAPPMDIRAELTASDPDQSQDGWWLASVASDTKSSIIRPVIFNEDGEIVWWFDPYDGAEGYMSYETTYQDGLVLYGGSIPQGERPVAVNLAGETVWEGVFSQPTDIIDHGTLHHTMYWTEEGDIAGLAINFAGNVISDVVFRVDPDATKLEDGSTEKYPVQDVADYVLDMGPYVDYDNGFFNNGVSFSKDSVYYYHHQGDALVKVNQDNEYVWTAGGTYGEFELINGGWPQKAHGMEVTEEDTILFFDNGGPDINGEFNTRAVKIQFDENDMTAEIVWQFPEPSSAAKEEMQTPCGGDADQLPNGNVLVATGIDNAGFPHRIFEVTEDHEIVREVTLTGEDIFGVYAVQLIPNLLQEIEIE
ncbi:aryl-sulfate sulfotransferase [Patescibacteria group bacterium]|nr:aryl-sulfate sulfotransferase [Patescibacteria group bacterium]MBU1674100.1 aryl-sulfate sulfotransferase [Patescibacteria group bacterium]MBU1963083.1 aryl-sulfate sulfotransferase [Patescibacteria group bacterium]